MGSELIENNQMSNLNPNIKTFPSSPGSLHQQQGMYQPYSSPPRTAAQQQPINFSPKTTQFYSDSISYDKPSSVASSTYAPSIGGLGGAGQDGGADNATDHEGNISRFQSSKGRNSWPEMSDTLHKMTGLVVGFGTVITECLISHPCCVIRYQCQINSTGRAKHLTPFTLMPFCYNLARQQGAAVLWKGLTSSFVSRGVSMAVETAFSDFFNLPREVTRVSSAKKVSQHLLLKAIAFGITTPFFATNFVEMVQSSIATDQSSLMDYLRETAYRFAGRGQFGSSMRLLPIYALIVPTACFQLAHYSISTLARVTTLSLQRHNESSRSISIGGGSVIDQSGYDSDDRNSIASSEPSAPLMQPDPARELRIQQQRGLAEMLAFFTGNLMADLILYPAQTVLNRLYIQGTRTIVDSTDSGLEVLAISTRYNGFFHCAHHIYRDEGIAGFFRGFGALILQYSLQAIMLRMASTAFDALAPSPRHVSDPVHNRRRSRRYR